MPNKICDNGLRRYTTEEYGAVAFTAILEGKDAALEQQRAMENLEALYFRGFHYNPIDDCYTDGKQRVTRRSVREVPKIWQGLTAIQEEAC